MSPPINPKATYSLQKRLLLAFGILLILFLGLAGFVLDQAFKESVAASVEQRLQLQVYALIGVAEPEAEGFFLPDLEEARFSQIDSGLYGFILDEKANEIWRSPSALNLSVSDLNFMGGSIEPGETAFGNMATTQQGSMSFASYGTFWPNQKQHFSFVVMESVEPTDAEISEFQSSLWLWLGGLAGLLSIAQYFLLNWGMRPLQRLAEDVSKIEVGKKDQLEEDYPAELQAVSHNLNVLIKSERERQSRYRTTLGDLAHSLKTPLAVISGVIQQANSQTPEFDKDMRDIDEQLERMNQIVSYQLKRAAQPRQTRLLSKAIKVAPVLEKLLSALKKVYLDKDIKLTSDIQPSALFYGEESDLMEMAGNLLDNAFKYGNKKVEVTVTQQNKQLVLEINDDGQGIAEQDRQWVLERGARVDTLKSGQGIGLAVAVDIISSYDGDIKVGKSLIGGAQLQVIIRH